MAADTTRVMAMTAMTTAIMMIAAAILRAVPPDPHPDREEAGPGKEERLPEELQFPQGKDTAAPEDTEPDGLLHKGRIQNGKRKRDPGD